MIIAAGLIAARLLHFAALTFLFGAGWAPAYADLDPVAARLRVFTRLGAGLALVGAMGWFVFAVAGMAGTFSEGLAPNTLLSIARSLSFGRVSTIRIVGCAVLALLTALPRQKRRAGFEWLLAGALLASIALTGHAREEEGWALILHVCADALHLLAAGLWLGGLAVFVVMFTGRKGSLEEKAGREALLRFSKTGIVAVAVLVATGLVNSIFLIGAPEHLFLSPYGWVLVVKLALFLAMLGMAGLNRRDLRREAPPMAALRRRVALEQALGGCVLLGVSVLGTMAPASMATGG